MGVVPLGHARVGVAEVRRDHRQRRPRLQQVRGIRGAECGSSPVASQRSKPPICGGPSKRLPCRRSHRISHPTSDYAVGLGGMNSRHGGQEVADFWDRKEQEATGWNGRQHITKPLHCRCANPTHARSRPSRARTPSSKAVRRRSRRQLAAANQPRTPAAHLLARVRRRPRTSIRCVSWSQGSTISSDLSPIETGRPPLRPIRGAPNNPLVGPGSVTYVVPQRWNGSRA
jgi:hypothetical protein